MSDLAQLHQGFCAFVEQTRKWSSPPPYDMAAPAFFLPNYTQTEEPEVDFAMPFAEIWLSFALPRDVRDLMRLPIDKSQVIVHVGGALPAPSMRIYQIGKTPGRWASLNLDQSSPQLGEIMNFIVCNCLDKISHSHDPETVEPAALTAINVGRAKSKKALKPLPAFITIENKPAADRGEPSGHSGVAKLPHNRRGHWRNLRSGKRVWVRDCAIHGGSDVGRNYVVKG